MRNWSIIWVKLKSKSLIHLKGRQARKICLKIVRLYQRTLILKVCGRFIVYINCSKFFFRISVHNVPAGCIDFEIFLKIFDYKYNHLWTNEEIAEEFDLDEKNVDDLLFFFKPFNNKIVDKKCYIANSYPAADKTYVKVAELLNRDVETFKEIPEYKKELARIEEENKQNQIEEITKEDEIYEETEDEYLERVNSQEFIKEKFFISDQTDQTDQTNETDKTDRTEKKENNSDKVKNYKKESSKDDIKEEPKKDEVKNEENKKSEVKIESNDKDAKKKTEANLKEETKKKTKNGKDKKEAKDDKKLKATKTKKNGKNSQSNGLKKDVKDNSK